MKFFLVAALLLTIFQLEAYTENIVWFQSFAVGGWTPRKGVELDKVYSGEATKCLVFLVNEDAFKIFKDISGDVESWDLWKKFCSSKDELENQTNRKLVLVKLDKNTTGEDAIGILSRLYEKIDVLLVDLTGGKLPAATKKKLTDKYSTDTSPYKDAITKLNKVFVERNKSNF